jgi:hypothetical protein
VERTTRSLVSHGLDMPQYPAGTYETRELGDHIMGVVALAWCTDDALDRWDESWARQGRIEARFRSHLTAGLALTIAAEHHAGRSDLIVAGSDGTTYATATVGPGPTTPSPRGNRSPGQPFPVPPRAASLTDYELHPVEFEFRADRDLRIVDHLGHAAFWRERGWAHPAWLASAANAIVRCNVDFEDGGYWLHAGVGVALHAPVRDGAHLVARGRVTELFERSTHRFMVCDVTIESDDQAMASIRSTSVYGAAIQPQSP